jgi:hypothetical protein
VVTAIVAVLAWRRRSAGVRGRDREV